MRLKLFLVFLLTVLTPTFVLVYFSIRAVEGERDILEKNIKEKYHTMARIVAEDMKTSLNDLPFKERSDPKIIEPLFFKSTLLFKDEVMIFDEDGKAVDGIRQEDDFPSPTYQKVVNDPPYVVSVYERFPSVLHKIKEIRARISRHFAIVALSAIAILLGGLFTLGELFVKWRKTEIKEGFISHLVHDLKRPLTSIRMFAEMLESDRVQSEEKRKEYYRIISVESEKLDQLAHNVLDFANIKNRGRTYQKKYEDISMVVKETVQRFQSNPVGNTHRVTLDILDHPMPKLKIDSGAISQALMNLLSNAVKYSPVGSLIQVFLSKTKNKVLISVCDQGIGISKKERATIFREYYRGKRQEVRNREGIGLGLALVQHTVRAHGGDIKVNSEEGGGSKFEISLPIN